MFQELSWTTYTWVSHLISKSSPRHHSSSFVRWSWNVSSFIQKWSTPLNHLSLVRFSLLEMWELCDISLWTPKISAINDIKMFLTNVIRFNRNIAIGDFSSFSFQFLHRFLHSMNWLLKIICLILHLLNISFHILTFHEVY